MSLTRVELPLNDRELYCLFCGQRVMDFNGEDETCMSPCTHTLFIATDYGFEYKSERLISIIGDKDPLDDEDSGMDTFTDNLNIDGITIAVYQPAPSFFGQYFGFSI